MIAGALYNGDGAGVAHCKAFTHFTRCVELATSGSIETGITHNRRLIRLKLTGGRRAQYQFAAGHALAHIIIGITFQVDL